MTARFALALLSAGTLSALARPAAAQEKNADLHLKRIVLYTAGVGFFEHSGQVEGDKQIDLRFDVDNINDLLKSMVVRDLGGGKVSSVTYDSQEPLGRALQTFKIDLTKNPSLGDLLRQARGEKIQIDGPNATTGIIVGIERRKTQVAKDQVADQELLILRTATGIRTAPLSAITEIKLLDEKLDKELQDALTLLAGAHAADKKTVSLKFAGKGARPVRVGYIQESPVWKTSYRLVLDDKEPPYLQGWAIVENQTEHDWRDVSVTLVSGRPVSFIQDLYEPLYVDRPLVTSELFAGLSPRRHDQDLASSPLGPIRANPNALGGGLGGGGAFGGGGFAGGGGFGGIVDRTQRPFVMAKTPVEAGDTPAEPLDLKQGVATAAQADRLGELFRYVIGTPVSLARNKSALLPIVNDSVKGKKLSLYNETVHARHPMNALKLNNVTDLHLMQGPIAVFDGGEFAGDAQIDDLSPGAERLITYALDLDTEVAVETGPSPEVTTSVRLAKGLILTERKQNRVRTYTVKNGGKKDKELLIEQPIDPAMKLTKPAEPAEKTRDLYRFALAVGAGKTQSLAVNEERIIKQKAEVANTGNDTLVAYAGEPTAGTKFKEAVQSILTGRAAIAQQEADAKAIRAKLDRIDTEQKRIRENLGAIDPKSDLARIYVKKLTEQEADLEKLNAELTAQDAEIRKAVKNLQALINGLETQ